MNFLAKIKKSSKGMFGKEYENASSSSVTPEKMLFSLKKFKVNSFYVPRDHNHRGDLMHIQHGHVIHFIIWHVCVGWKIVSSRKKIGEEDGRRFLESFKGTNNNV